MLCAAIGIVGGKLFISSCVTIGTYLVATLGCLTGFILCVYILVYGVCCSCFLVGYRCINGAITCFVPDENSYIPLQHTLFLLVDFCSASFEIMLNNSARLINSAWWVLFNVVNGAIGEVFCGGYVKSCADSVAVSVDETLCISTCCGEIPQCMKCDMILFQLQNFCNT